METSVKQQLLTCQEMLQEIEQKVASLSDSSSPQDLNQKQDLEIQGGPVSAGSDQESAELLASKLELLKTNLVSFQHLLEERQGEEKMTPSPQPQDPGERPPLARLRRSASVQEMFSSPKNKLLRQSSVQQQKELEQELSEQRGLTRAIARQHSRGRLHSQDPEEHSLPSPRVEKEEEVVRRSWDLLQTRLLALEESFLRPEEQGADSSVRVGVGGGVRTIQVLKDLQDLSARLQALGTSAAVRQGDPAGSATQQLVEGVYDVLYGASLALSSVNTLLRSPPVMTRTEGAELQLLQLQNLSAALGSLGVELASLGSEVRGALGSECLELLIRVLPAVQTGLTDRRNRLEVPQQKSSQLQDQAREVDALLEEVNSSSLPVSLSQQASELQGALDVAQAGVSSRREELQVGADLQRHYERLVRGLEELVSLGSQRLSLLPSAELHTRDRLEELLSSHTKFFQSLDGHWGSLQYLFGRAQDSAPGRWAGEVQALQDKISELRLQALEHGCKMEDTLQVWAQWEQDSSWLDSLLSDTETSTPKMQQAQDSEEELSNRLNLYQKLSGALEDSRPRLGQLMEAGLRLQGAGCREVGVATKKLEARWNSLCKTLGRDRMLTDRNRKLLNRFTLQSASLIEWMGGARELIDRWIRSVDPANQDQPCLPKSWDDIVHQFMEFSKELESQSELRASVVSAGTLLSITNQGESEWARDTERDQEGDELPPAAQPAGPDPGYVSSQLRQVDLVWNHLQTEVPEIQHKIHQRWVESLGHQGAMEALEVWITRTEAQLENQGDDHNQCLCFYKDCQREMCFHQATLDFIHQPVVQGRSTLEGQGGRCGDIELAEQQGLFHHRWLSLHWNLHRQVQDVAEGLRSRSQRQERLNQISSWITCQRTWLDSALSPNSQSEIEKSLRTCEDLEEKIQQRASELQALSAGDQALRGLRPSSEVERAMESCSALSQQRGSVVQSLTQFRLLWARLETTLRLVTAETTRTAQTLRYHGDAQPCLQAQRDVHKALQCVRDEAEAASQQWDVLDRDISSLQDQLSPAARDLLHQRRDTQRDRWAQVRRSVDISLCRGGALLEKWEEYTGLTTPLLLRLQTLQGETAALMTPTDPTQDPTQDRFRALIQTAESLLQRAAVLQTDLEEGLRASKDLIGHLDPMTSDLVQSECRLLSCGVLQLNQSLVRKMAQLLEELDRLQDFDGTLGSLEEHLDQWQKVLGGAQTQCTPLSQCDLLEPSGWSADLDILNEQSHFLPLGGAATHRLQRLNHAWAEATARALEACSVLQAAALQQQCFGGKCEMWTEFLQKMEDSLVVDLPGSHAGLRDQLRTHQRFQVEVSIGHQTLHSVVSEALLLLQRGEVEDRSDFLLQLSQLREQWAGAVGRASQRCSLVEGLVKHRHVYTRGLRKIQSFLSESRDLLPPAGPPRTCLLLLHRSWRDLQRMDLLSQRYQSSYLQTLEVGRQLFSVGDEETQAGLQTELGSLQEHWDQLHQQLGKRMELTRSIIQSWERCETRLADSTLTLKDVKTRLNQSMSESPSELPSEEQFYQESQSMLGDWAESLSELSLMKTDLSQYIMADNVLLLQEQIAQLNSQWEDLCLQVSLRKQEIADRLNAWVIFNEKNKELCDWLSQMENRVLDDSDTTIEDMVEKLKKDCMEEINLFGENKGHLKQLGEQLLSASHPTREMEVHHKIQDITDRWQHLFDHIETRVRKLKETLGTIQRLDKSMSSLRTWLARVEAELTRPVVYDRCHSDEIQKKLSEQQELQRDIEQHSAGVSSVLALCDVLLRDGDVGVAGGVAGGVAHLENDSIQQTSCSLDRRWRNICAMSMERRMRIEETWRLWSKFLEDHARFEAWLRSAEVTAANPQSADVLYPTAKEELKKFEAFQRQVHERLTQLELVNKQYRRLARENRTDSSSRLKALVTEGNRRWDVLQRRVAAVLRRLKHFTSQREDFEGTREGILVWLTEMDLQLTNVEHFSQSDVEDKMRQLHVFQKEITLNTERIDGLIVFGERLIQRSAPLDAVLLEDELQELHSYCQEVFGRVARFHQRLLRRRPVLEEEEEEEERDLDDLEDSVDLGSGAPWSAGERVGPGGPVLLLGGGQAMCHLLAPPLERSGRGTPASLDSIPLEWDHTVDVGGSSSHEDEEEAIFFSALSDVGVTKGSESVLMATARAMVAASVKSGSEGPSWHQPSSPDMKPREGLRGRTASPSHTPTSPSPQQGYAKLMSECSGSINSVKRVKLILNGKEELEEAGLTCSTAEKHTCTGVIERWELFQAQTIRNELDIHHDLEQWKKLNSDLSDVTSWLGSVVPELEGLQRLAPATSLQDIERNIWKLKDMQRTFNRHKSLVISINLSGRHFQRGVSPEVRGLQEDLQGANEGWTRACAGLQAWEGGLRGALMECQEFHETLHSLLLGLAQVESHLQACSAQDAPASRSALLGQRELLTEVEEELLGQQQQVASLQEISSQLLLEVTEEDGLEAKEKVHVIANKLHLLLRRVAAELRALQGRLETSPTSSETYDPELGALRALAPPPALQQVPALRKEITIRMAGPRDASPRPRAGPRDASPPRSFFHRVLRAAFPLHLLFLLLLVCLVCLVPLTEEPYSCTLANNFARSFYPMLRYTNGPPPT
ncbi:unnamed protein product [Lota lota]